MTSAIIEEGSRVRLLADVERDGGGTVPAETVGTVVDNRHAPGQYSVDVVVDGEFDNVPVSGEGLEVIG